MFRDNRILALIPARGGSKGIKGKNIYPLNGKPLISYTIKAAKECEYIDEIIVSTDSDEISAVAKEYGAEVPFIRPEILSNDTAKTIDVVLHAISRLEKHKSIYDIVVLLQPTSPLRSGYDIKKALEIFFENGMKSLVSVSKTVDHPILIRSIKKGYLVKILDQDSTVRRQDMKEYYKINGSIYINRINCLNEMTCLNENIIPYIMPIERSIDIDTRFDIRMAEIFLREQKRRGNNNE